MQEVTSRASSVITTIEVDGVLNAVSVYDLQRLVDTAVRRGSRRIDLDLTRVTNIDDDGIRGLMRFCGAAVTGGTSLTFTATSRPATQAMRRHHIRQANRLTERAAKRP